MSTTPPKAAGPIDFRTHGRYRVRHSGSPLPGLETIRPPMQRFRGRIGAGFRPEANRYHLYLCLACPRSLRVAITRDLAGLGEVVGTSLVDPVRDGRGWAFRDGDGHGLDPNGGFAFLREAYEATEYHYDGPVSVPVLWDRWSGRIVSNHAPHILRDLATGFGTGNALYPAERAEELCALDTLFEEDVTDAAQRAGRASAGPRRAEAMSIVTATLAVAERRLAARPFLLGDTLTAADVQLWTTLVHLDAVHKRHLAAEDVHRLAAHPHLWAYARRLNRIPAFRDNLRLDHIARNHRSHCRGPAASGVSIALNDWS
ncbi:glutathione S-transferase C-terminal domain-containing protein [Embleya sp. NPDC050493]|uniref:glutathione S-transferase C-terminal domain-containing protein n=1 Tax=Embleya sp. NPDC050493 TaxID=3363989 RepID=UPI0037B8E66C